MAEEPITAEEFREVAAEIETQVGQVIVGQGELVRHTLITLLAGGNALLEGVPGLGKTMLVRTLAQAIDCAFSRIQFTPDLMPADIVGTNLIVEDEQGRRQFQFEPGPIFANLVLADEINRATPKTQSAMLEAMQEHTRDRGQGRPAACPSRSSCWPPRTRWKWKAPTRCPKRSSTASSSRSMCPSPSVDDLVEIANRTTATVNSQRQPRPPTASKIRAMQALARGVPIATACDRLCRPAAQSHPPRRRRQPGQSCASSCATGPARAACRP